MTLTVEDLLARIETLEAKPNPCRCASCLHDDQQAAAAIRIRAAQALCALGAEDAESFAREIRKHTAAERSGIFGPQSADVIEKIAMRLVAVSDWSTLQLLLDACRGAVKDCVVGLINPAVTRYRITTPPGVYCRASCPKYVSRAVGLEVIEAGMSEYVTEISYEKFDLKDVSFDFSMHGRDGRHVTSSQLRMLKAHWNLQELIDQGRISLLEISKESSLEISAQELARRGVPAILNIPSKT